MMTKRWYFDGVVLPCIDDDYYEGQYIYRRGDKEYQLDFPDDPWKVVVRMPEPEQKFPYKFRVLDDDGVVYATGYSADDSSEDAFAPLDWAASQWGCTYIEYCNPETGEWEML